jgi:hypothetical protein
LSAARAAQGRWPCNTLWTRLSRTIDNGQVGATLAEALCPVYAANLTGAHKCDAPGKIDDGRILKHAEGTDNFHRSSTKIEPERQRGSQRHPRASNRVRRRVETSLAVREQHGNTVTWVKAEPPDAVVFPHSTQEVSPTVGG